MYKNTCTTRYRQSRNAPPSLRNVESTLKREILRRETLTKQTTIVTNNPHFKSPTLVAENPGNALLTDQGDLEDQSLEAKNQQKNQQKKLLMLKEKKKEREKRRGKRVRRGIESCGR